MAQFNCFTKIAFGFAILWCTLLVAIKSEEDGATLSACEMEKLLRPLLSSSLEENTIQAQALRRRLINLIRQGFREQVDNGIEDNMNPSSPNDWDELPEKRNLQALAREGYIKTLPDEEDDDSSYKRSFRYTGKNERFSTDPRDPEIQETKRGIESLARNGELNRSARQNLENLLEQLYYKRDTTNSGRDFAFPVYGKRFLGSLVRNGDYVMGKGTSTPSSTRNGKRNLASLVKNNNLPTVYDVYKRSIASLARDGEKLLGKRNVAALLRQDNYLNEKNQNTDGERAQTEKPDGDDGEGAGNVKRNLASVKAGYKPKYKRAVPYSVLGNIRSRRQADFYDDDYPQPTYRDQNDDDVDYEDILRTFAAVYPNYDKRFLGSLARSGSWPSSLIRYRNPDKRHIGSLARLGWLPSFRSARRFNRSGRSTRECGVCREVTTDGQTEDDPYSESTEKEDKRLLLIPAVDKILLRKSPSRPPRIHH